MCKAGRPPKAERRRLLKECELTRQHFLLDASLVRFYHVRNGKGDKTLGVTVVEDQVGTWMIAAVVRRHSSDTTFYGPVAENHILIKMNRDLRVQVNRKIIQGNIKQFKPVLPPKEDRFSKTVWKRGSSYRDAPDFIGTVHKGPPEVDAHLESPHRVRCPNPLGDKVLECVKDHPWTGFKVQPRQEWAQVIKGTSPKRPQKVKKTKKREK
jgi:hypothetical protein